MSSCLLPYLIEFETLQRAVGNGDRALLAALKEEFAEEIENADDEFEEEIAEGMMRLGAALDALIEGQRIEPESDHQYAHALELLCKHFGELLEDDLFMDFRAGWLDRVGWLDPLLQKKAPFEFLKDVDDPFVAYFSPADARSEYARLKERDPADPDEDVAHARLQYLDWLEAAAETNQAIVAFWC